MGAPSWSGCSTRCWSRRSAIVAATISGFVVGIARLAPNWLVSRLAGDLCRDHPQHPAAAADLLLVLRRAARPALPRESLPFLASPISTSRPLRAGADRGGRVWSRSRRCRRRGDRPDRPGRTPAGHADPARHAAAAGAQRRCWSSWSPGRPGSPPGCARTSPGSTSSGGVGPDRRSSSPVPGAVDLHRGLHRRGGARRRAVGEPRPDRGGRRARPHAAARRCASSWCRRRCASSCRR